MGRLWDMEFRPINCTQLQRRRFLFRADQSALEKRGGHRKSFERSFLVAPSINRGEKSPREFFIKAGRPQVSKSDTLQGNPGQKGGRKALAGQRQPIELLVAKGKKHLTKAEIEERQSLKVLSRSLSDFGAFLLSNLKWAGSHFRAFPP